MSSRPLRSQRWAGIRLDPGPSPLCGARGDDLKYVSTRGHAAGQSFTEILLEGLGADGGLMVPEDWPRIMPVKLAAMRDLPYPRLAFEIIRFFADDFPGAELKAITEAAYSSANFG